MQEFEYVIEKIGIGWKSTVCDYEAVWKMDVFCHLYHDHKGDLKNYQYN